MFLGISEIERQTYRKLIADFFDDPVLYFLRETENYILYARRMQSYLLNENHCLVAFVPTTSWFLKEKGAPRSLVMSTIPWTIVQTRNLKNEEWLLEVPKHPYHVKDHGFYRSPIRKVEDRSNDEFTLYELEDSAMTSTFHITLLHQKRGLFEYPNKGTLGTALESYQCIMELVEK